MQINVKRTLLIIKDQKYLHRKLFSVQLNVVECSKIIKHLVRCIAILEFEADTFNMHICNSVLGGWDISNCLNTESV